MSDNIDQQVKFKSTSQEVYDNLAEKDPNSLYFAEDSQKLYKGDIQFSNGLIDESNFIPIYELSEDEFWDKVNSGQLDVAEYKYETVCAAYNELSENIVWDLEAGYIIDAGDNYYAASRAKAVGGVLTKISKDLQSIKSFNFTDMVPHRDKKSPLTCVRDCYHYNDLIGYDGDGYLYINVQNCNNVVGQSDSYSSGILAIDTKDIDNSASWNIITTFDSSTKGIAFRPFNLQRYLYGDDHQYDWAPLMYRDPMLKSKDGGIFGFGYVVPHTKVTKQSNSYIPASTHSIWYFKSGHATIIGPEESASIDGGCRCFTTNPDNDDNLYYINHSANPIDHQSTLWIGALNKDGASKLYYIDLDHAMSGFSSSCSANASFLRCKNNKVFMFLADLGPLCVVLDLKSEEYSSIYKLRNFSFNAESEEQVVSNIVETDTSICFTIFNGKICWYVCWNFIEDKIYSRESTVYVDGSAPAYLGLCNILRVGQDNTLISSYIDYTNRELNIATLSCENLQPVRRYVVSDISRYGGTLAGQPIYETSDNRMIVFAYMCGESWVGGTYARAISIDTNGNATLLAGLLSGNVSAGSGTRDILIPSSEPGLLLQLDLDNTYDRRVMSILNVNKNRVYMDLPRIGMNGSWLKAVILSDNTIINTSYIGDTVNPAYLIDAGRAMRSYIVNSSIKILPSGDITQ